MRTQFSRGNIAAAVLLVGGVTGTVLDPDGPVGIPLFGVAALAALYLISRPLRSTVSHRADVARPKRFRRRTVRRSRAWPHDGDSRGCNERPPRALVDG